MNFAWKGNCRQFDILTGLLCHQSITNKVEEALKAGSILNQPVSILMLDIDSFGLVNEQYGHVVGDAILQLFGDVLRREVQENALIGRLAQDEFVIVLPECDQWTAHQTAERIRSSLQTKGLKLLDGIALHVTTSIGLVTVFPNNAPLSSKSVLQQADRALFEAKRSGRNCICMFSHPGGKNP